MIYIKALSYLFKMRCWCVLCVCLTLVRCQVIDLREGSDLSSFPENTAAARFLKYSFARLDEGDVKSLSIVMRAAFRDLCVALHGCDRAKSELEGIYEHRFNELEINYNKMRKLGFLFRMLISAVEENDGIHNNS